MRPFYQIHASKFSLQRAGEILRSSTWSPRGKFDGSTEKRFIGNVAQEEICLRLQVPSISDLSRHDFEMNGLKWDVKTQIAKYPPSMMDQICLPACQIEYDVDYYLFMKNPGDALGPFWVQGLISKENLKRRASLYREGEITRRNNGDPFIFKTDSYQFRVADLYQIRDLRDIWITGREDSTRLGPETLRC